jgi:hypothetical protein
MLRNSDLKAKVSIAKKLVGAARVPLPCKVLHWRDFYAYVAVVAENQIQCPAFNL